MTNRDRMLTVKMPSGSQTRWPASFRAPHVLRPGWIPGYRHNKYEPLLLAKPEWCDSCENKSFYNLEQIISESQERNQYSPRQYKVYVFAWMTPRWNVKRSAVRDLVSPRKAPWDLQLERIQIRVGGASDCNAQHKISDSWRCKL